jgi:hypothetical protein
MAQAGAPLVFSLLIDATGGEVLIVSSALSLSALFALYLNRPEPPFSENAKLTGSALAPRNSN